MRFSDVLAVSLAVVPFVAAHGGIPGTPKLWGLKPEDIAKLKRRSIFEGRISERAHYHAPRHAQLNARQGGLGGMCGPTASEASCDEGYCCSSAGKREAI